MPKARIVRRQRSEARTAQRRGIACLAIFGFVLQLFLLTAHIHIDEEGWIGLPLPAGAVPLPPDHYGLFAGGHAELGYPPALRQALGTHQSDSPVIPAGKQQRPKHPDCQVCQTVPLASSSIASIAIVLAPSTLGTAPYLITSRDAMRRIEICTCARPRAPPIQL